jgi:hypothetical protein
MRQHLHSSSLEQHVEELRRANAILHSDMPPPSDQDRELQVAYHRLSEAEHGWHYFRQQLDAAREMLDERTHAIIHLKHHIKQQDLLEADDWLRTTESKFSLLHCTEYQKTLYAAQQLRGPAGAWWASYTTALPADHHVSWGEFRAAFHGHHLSVGTMHHKLAEFLDLHQRNHSIYEYIQEFNNLA